jgi:hypothetical protein
MDNCAYSISYGAWPQVAAAYVQNCNRDPHGIAGPRTTLLMDGFGGCIQSPRARVQIDGGDRMKYMLFILVAQLHAGGSQTVAAYPSLEQCRDALNAAATNVAADYTCAATPVEGRWSQKDARYFMVRE